jgi:5-methylthioadenosine/S-adenosylhomocysteine deaminase
MAERMLIKGGMVLTMDPAVGDLTVGDVLIDDGVIVQIAPEIVVDDAKIIDASSRIVMPGFVDTHRHIWQAAMRNLCQDWTLASYFTGVHAGLSRHFTPEDIYTANLLGSLEALAGGVTTVLDWSHGVNTPEHSDGAIAGLKESGARAVFAHGGGADHYQVPSTVPHPEDARRIRSEYFSSDTGDDLVTMALALRGPQFADKAITVGDFGLARELGLRITVHVGDGEWGRDRPVAWMRDAGLLGSDITFVHCNTIADDEMLMMAESGGTASVAADVEMMMGHGWPATGRLLDAGIRPSLSIDICSSNGGHMFGAMRSTIGSQRGLDHANAQARGEEVERLRVTCPDMVSFATVEGAKALGLDHKIGSLSPGKAADLLLVRTDDLGMVPLIHPYGALVYNAHPGLVDTVMVGGRIVKQGGEMIGLDFDRLRHRAEDNCEKLFERARREPALAEAATGGKWTPKPYVAP